MLKFLLFFYLGTSIYAQQVTTFFEDTSIDVDDSMIFDSDGNLYGSNFNGSTVYKITPDGVGEPFITGLANPNGLAFDNDGNLFLAEFSAQRINKYDTDGNLLESFTTVGAPSGLIQSFDGTAMIYTNVSDDSVNRLEADGTSTILYEGSPLIDPVGLTYDENGVLYVGNFTGRMIHKLVDDTMVFVATVPDGGATGGNAALGFIVYANERIYGTNFGGHEIYSVNPDGVDDLFVYAGGDAGDQDGDLDEATFSYPNGIIYNETQDSFYISEFSGQGNIRVINNATLSVIDFSEEFEIVVSPNPVIDVVTITSNNSTIKYDSVGLYNNLGQVLKTVTNSQNTTKLNIDISQFATGVYFLKLEDTTGSFLVKKVIKQ